MVCPLLLVCYYSSVPYYAYYVFWQLSARKGGWGKALRVIRGLSLNILCLNILNIPNILRGLSLNISQLQAVQSIVACPVWVISNHQLIKFGHR